MLLERLGIYGWPERQENLLLTSLLTGDPLLLIGPHGCAKTYLASRVAQALRRRFTAYDASKAMFEDVLGYPNLEKLKQGMVDYVPGSLTIWDKEMILIDELNRALPELQSKWLEIVRSRRIMGLPTRVRWVWAAMNPNTYTGTQELDQALLGRFALYVYPPGVLEMSEADRIKVTQAMSDDDAPALREWLYADPHRPSQGGESTSQGLTGTVPLAKTLHSAARHYGNLREDLWQLPLFLSRLAELLRGESQGQICLDGRRLGFLYRNILAHRSVELAKVELGNADLSPLADSVRLVITASIPLGLDETLIDQEKARHQLELCCDLLSDFLNPARSSPAWTPSMSCAPPTTSDGRPRSSSTGGWERIWETWSSPGAGNNWSLGRGTSPPWPTSPSRWRLADQAPFPLRCSRGSAAGYGRRSSPPTTCHPCRGRRSSIWIR